MLKKTIGRKVGRLYLNYVLLVVAVYSLGYLALDYAAISDYDYSAVVITPAGVSSASVGDRITYTATCWGGGSSACSIAWHNLRWLNSWYFLSDIVINNCSYNSISITGTVEIPGTYTIMAECPGHGYDTATLEVAQQYELDYIRYLGKPISIGTTLTKDDFLIKTSPSGGEDKAVVYPLDDFYTEGDHTVSAYLTTDRTNVKTCTVPVLGCAFRLSAKEPVVPENAPVGSFVAEIIDVPGREKYKYYELTNDCDGKFELYNPEGTDKWYIITTDGAEYNKDEAYKIKIKGTNTAP